MQEGPPLLRLWQTWPRSQSKGLRVLHSGGVQGKGTVHKRQERGSWSVLCKEYGLLLSLPFVYTSYHAVSTY